MRIRGHPPTSQLGPFRAVCHFDHQKPREDRFHALLAPGASGGYRSFPAKHRLGFIPDGHGYLALAVRHEVLPRNRMEHVSRLRRPAHKPDIFPREELKAIRAGISTWEHRPIKAGPKPDGQLGQIVEVMLGTSARTKEALAIQLDDLERAFGKAS